MMKKMMLPSSFLSLLSLLLLLLLSLLPFSLSQSPLFRGKLIDCGATTSKVIKGREWLPDTGFVSTGTPRNLTTTGLFPTLTTVRTFPLRGNVGRKFCYVIPVYRTGKYLIRTTYFYGGVNGGDLPPVFDQIVDGTFWVTVNTTSDYVEGRASYYEGIFAAGGKTMSLCIAPNKDTDSDPFISALEFVLLANSVYNSTDFGSFGLSLVVRHSFGYTGSIIQYPDDPFDRYWEPFGENDTTIRSTRNVSVSGFWNLPPLKVFQTDMVMNTAAPLVFKWPPGSIPNSTYYIALYFAGDPVSSSGRQRIFDISINGILYYHNLKVNPAGLVVFANQWLLAGHTEITLIPTAGSIIGPLINAGEVLGLLPLGGRTITRDVIALERVKKGFLNPPLDWNGDPCLPRQYAWTGVTCSEGPRIRVISLNLTNMGLSGSLSPNLANLSALTGMWLWNNSLSGSIPDLSSLKRLEILHLDNNKLTGEIPPLLGNIAGLRELFLQGNSLFGHIPKNLLEKPGLDMRLFPGNPALQPPH